MPIDVQVDRKVLKETLLELDMALEIIERAQQRRAERREESPPRLTVIKGELPEEYLDFRTGGHETVRTTVPSDAELMDSLLGSTLIPD